jgi:phosphodiesterase/alkaline phosphatase D-like protein
MQTQNGNTVRPVSANIAGLLANRIYHFRIVAHNNGGTSFGVDRTFTTVTATGPPVVATNPATLLASFSATLNGSLNPHGLNTTVSFQYGPTTAYGSTTPMQTKTGNTYLGIVANISGLSPNTLYHFRIVATNSAGTRFGGDRTFRTLSVTGPPVATTNPATFIASFSARLNALINPHGLPTSVHFQYGTTPSYGLTTAPQNRTGNTFQAVAANVAGLTANTLYHFRVVASNNAGTIMGSDRTFTTLTPTGPPVVITNGPTNVAASSATLNGSLNPHGLATNVFFQYGTTTSYGSATPMQSQNGNTYRNITANINGLTPHSTYHFRMIATNAGGTRMGSDRTFTTH